jgi:hypothetical protein
MEAAELSSVEARLRVMLIEVGLSWVVDEVDRAILEGIPRERLLRRRRATVEPDVWDARAFVVQDFASESQVRAAKRTGSVVISTEPLSPLQRVEAYIAAIQRIVVDLPRTEAEVARILKASDNTRREPVEAVIFGGDSGEGGEPLVVGTETSSEITARGEQVVQSLRGLVSE